MARKEVSIRLGRIQEKQKKPYDIGHQVVREFQPWEEVLVYKPIRKVGRAEKVTSPLNRSLCGAAEDSGIKLRGQAE